jgi:hypothetical protein
MFVFTIGVRSIRQPQFPNSAPTITTARDLLGGFISPLTLFSQTHAGSPKEHKEFSEGAAAHGRDFVFQIGNVILEQLRLRVGNVAVARP